MIQKARADDQMGTSYRLIAHDQVHNMSSPILPSSWQPPPCDILKVNVNATVLNSNDYFRVGIVGRDSNGDVYFSKGVCLPGRFFSYLAELVMKVGVDKSLSPTMSN